MKCAVYDPVGGGKILQRITGPPSMVEPYLDAGNEIYLNCPDSATHIINNDPVTIITPPTLEEIRIKRNTLLYSCDWTQVIDSPLTPGQMAAWAVYRQQLRDFLEMCDVNNPVWPAPPN
jgi:hypothetical protein